MKTNKLIILLGKYIRPHSIAFAYIVKPLYSDILYKNKLHIVIKSYASKLGQL